MLVSALRVEKAAKFISADERLTLLRTRVRVSGNAIGQDGRNLACLLLRGSIRVDAMMFMTAPTVARATVTIPVPLQGVPA
jgi:hypothetical protein